MSRNRRPAQRRPALTLQRLCIVLVIVCVGLAIALVHEVQSNGSHPTADAMSGTVAALRTEVARDQRLVATGQTAVARQQQIIENLQRAATAQPSPTLSTGSENGPRSYLASFLSNKISYVIYMDWTETNGFIKNGRMLTADNYGPPDKSRSSFQFSGVDNSGSYGFTGSGSATSMTFTATRNDDGSLSVRGLPWSVFYGIVGVSTFSQTLHPSSVSLYNAAVSSLAHQTG